MFVQRQLSYSPTKFWDGFGVDAGENSSRIQTPCSKFVQRQLPSSPKGLGQLQR